MWTKNADGIRIVPFDVVLVVRGATLGVSIMWLCGVMKNWVSRVKTVKCAEISIDLANLADGCISRCFKSLRFIFPALFFINLNEPIRLKRKCVLPCSLAQYVCSLSWFISVSESLILIDVTGKGSGDINDPMSQVRRRRGKRMHAAYLDQPRSMSKGYDEESFLSNGAVHDLTCILHHFAQATRELAVCALCYSTELWIGSTAVLAYFVCFSLLNAKALSLTSLRPR